MLRTLLALVLAVAMVPAAWAQSSYRIQPGDVLQLEVLEDPTLNRSLLVLPDGSVSVPLAGTIKASGMTIDGLRAQIGESLASNFATKPTIFLSVGQLAAPPATTAATTATATTISVYALGEVNKPGLVPVEPGTTLLQFLAASGGLSQFAAAKRIQLRRVDMTTGLESVYNFNYKSVQNGGKAPHIVLQAGDVIVVPERRLFE
jgi:polysaccharide export outer membrane protein